jgi:predicted RNA-binding protein with PUA-like domain
VRNFQARNHMRAMAVGDRVLFYHSSTEPPGVAGLATVAKVAYPDHSAWDAKGDYFDPKSPPEKPQWFMVDVRFERKLPRFVPLDELRAQPGLAGMVLLQRGSRLSVQPVEPAHFELILKLAERPAAPVQRPSHGRPAATKKKPAPRRAPARR